MNKDNDMTFSVNVPISDIEEAVWEYLQRKISAINNHDLQYGEFTPLFDKNNNLSSAELTFFSVNQGQN